MDSIFHSIRNAILTSSTSNLSVANKRRIRVEIRNEKSLPRWERFMLLYTFSEIWRFAKTAWREHRVFPRYILRSRHRENLSRNKIKKGIGIRVKQTKNSVHSSGKSTFAFTPHAPFVRSSILRHRDLYSPARSTLLPNLDHKLRSQRWIFPHTARVN